MLKTFTLNAEIPPNREIHLTLPEDFPVGPAEIVLVVSTQTQAVESTLGDLARSEFFGMWADRDDIRDSVEFARKLRSDAWKSSG